MCVKRTPPPRTGDMVLVSLSLTHIEVSSTRPPAMSLSTHQHAWWPGPQKVQSAPDTHLWDPRPPSPLLSPTDGTVSMGAVDRRAEWDLPTGEASSHRSHILHCSLPWTRGLISLGGAVLICRAGRLTHPPSQDCGWARGRRQS